MNYLKMGIAKSKPQEPRDVKILAHIWPTDKGTLKDIRFDFYGKNTRIEVDLVSKLLITYGSETHTNPVNFHTKTFVVSTLLPLLQKRLAELGLNIRWITVGV